MVTTFPQRKQFTLNEYHRMGETGILHEDDRVELIDGEIIKMTPIGLRHAACVNRLNRIFSSRLYETQTIVSIQNPLVIDECNEPVPDIVLLRYRDDCYETKRATADDALLVIEVSDSTLPYDRNVKVPLYAKSRIHELWIVDLQNNTVETYYSSNGKAFHEKRQYTAKDSIVPLAFPDQPVFVSSIIGTEGYQA